MKILHNLDYYKEQNRIADIISELKADGHQEAAQLITQQTEYIRGMGACMLRKEDFQSSSAWLNLCNELGVSHKLDCVVVKTAVDEGLTEAAQHEPPALINVKIVISATCPEVSYEEIKKLEHHIEYTGLTENYPELDNIHVDVTKGEN